MRLFRFLLFALMVLLPAEALRLAAAPAHAPQLAACVRHEQRIRLHAAPSVDEATPQPGLAVLLGWVQLLLPADKFAIFRQFVRQPVATTELVDTIFDGLARVYEAQDAHTECHLAAPELEADFAAYRQAQDENIFWAGEVLRATRRAPHSVLVVELPAEQHTPRPEPYPLLLDIGTVLDVALKADGTCEYLIYRLPGFEENGQRYEQAACYDDAAYVLLRRREGSEQWEETLRAPHALGYCPARMLWSDPLHASTTPARNTVLTGQLAQLDKYILWEASVEYYKMYGTWPIFWSFEEQCQYQGPEQEPCVGGFVHLVTGASAAGVLSYQRTECPACSRKKAMGPGSMLTVPAPNKDVPDTRNPVGMVSVDVPALQNATQELSSRADRIVTMCLGGVAEAQNAAAKNTTQVRGQFETRQDALQAFAANLETAWQWVLDTQGRLRYAAAYRSSAVSLGEEWFLKTPEQLAQEAVQLKQAGRPMFELALNRQLYYDTKYRRNPTLRERVRVLSDLEPFTDTTPDELEKLNRFTPGALLAPEMRLKFDFPRYIARFEAEQMDVTVFGSLQSYGTKLRLITQKLLEYVDQDLARSGPAQTQESEPGGAPGPAA